MLKATLDAVATLNYPNFECIVIINNTPDPAFWQPVEEHCRTLGERFKFVREDNCQGFKAGALRLALDHTAPDAEIIGVIDADYIVTPDWLTNLVPVFADPKVGLIQAPQDHRDGDRSVMHYAMQGEYSGFFDIGMVQRNEKNAIIVHGTMCLMRRDALVAAGNWSSDTICEDTDLGLTMIELGWKVHYTNRRYGFGLLPESFEAFKKQRHRWAYGGVQIVKKHWRRFLPGVSQLSREQRREFTLGWLVWLGAESLGVVVAILNLIWVPVVVFAGIAIPDKILTIPIIAAFAVALLHFMTLYRLRVPINKKQTLGAVVRRHVRAVDGGARGRRRPDQGSPALHPHRQGRTAARSRCSSRPSAEAVLGGCWSLGAITVLAFNKRRHPRTQHLRGRADAAEPAVPVGRGARRDRRLALQRVRDLEGAADARRWRCLPKRAARIAKAAAPARSSPRRSSNRSISRTNSKGRSLDRPFCFGCLGGQTPSRPAAPNRTTRSG